MKRESQHARRIAAEPERITCLGVLRDVPRQHRQEEECHEEADGPAMPWQDDQSEGETEFGDPAERDQELGAREIGRDLLKELLRA